MPPRSAIPGQLDLLGWSAPEPVRRFAEERVRGVTMRDRLSRAIGACLKDADARGLTREEIAVRMSEFLGEKVSTHMVNAYASPARDDHVISVTRLMALLHATGDQRLLELIAEPMGWAVVERKYLPLIELAAVRERADELAKRSAYIRRLAKREGTL